MSIAARDDWHYSKPPTKEELLRQIKTKEPQFGYHKAPITKGTLGEVSKISEEYFEFMDAVDQGVKLMQLQELSDMLGAVDKFLQNHFPGVTLDDLVTMAQVTERAFKAGVRG